MDARRDNSSETKEKVRLIVLTDIGADPDDEQSLVRLLLYADEFEVEGLIAGALLWSQPGRHWRADGRPATSRHWMAVHPELIEERIRAYGKVLPNLRLHKADYPSEERLLSVVKCGLPNTIGPPMMAEAPESVWQHLGESKDTDGSEWIISVVDKPDARPVWFAVWGGPRELAQAVWKVAQTRTPEELARFKSKLRVYAIGDQDNGGWWLEREHPGIFWLRNGRENHQEPLDNQMARGMYQLGDESLMSRPWLEEHVLRNHGPLGATYPPKTWSPPNDAMKEGDTPSWFYLLPNGLGNPAEPAWGGWGGRFEKGGARYEDAEDTLWGITNERVCVARWRPHWQADLQARMDWCVQPYARANHEPVAVVEGPLQRTVAPGETVSLSAAGSSDPDGDELSYQWSFYPEPSSYRGPLKITNPDSQAASFTAPAVTKAETIHIILTVTDHGAPPLSRYQRVVVMVEPL